MRAFLLLAVVTGCSLSAEYGGTTYRCEDGVCPAGQTCVSQMCVPEAVIDGPSAPPDGPASTPDATPGPPDAGPPDAGPAFNPPWWDEQFPYRERLRVTNLASSTLPAGFQVRWRFNLQGDLAVSVTDEDTVRVARWDGASWTELNRVLDDTAKSTELLWIRTVVDIPAGGSDDSYFLYYGAPDTVANAPGSWSTMWDFYDGFNGSSLDAAEWFVNPSGTTVQTLSGEVILEPGESIRSTYEIGMNEAMDFTILVADGTSARWWGGLQIADTFADDEPWAIWITRSENAGNIWPELQADAAGITAPELGPTSPLVDDEENLYTVIRQPTRMVWEREGTEVHTETVPSSWTQALNLRFTNQSLTNVLVHFARTRQYIRPFPVGERLELEMLPP